VVCLLLLGELRDDLADVRRQTRAALIHHHLHPPNDDWG